MKDERYSVPGDLEAMQGDDEQRAYFAQVRKAAALTPDGVRERLARWLAGVVRGQVPLSDARLHAALEAARAKTEAAVCRAYTDAVSEGCDANGAYDCAAEEDTATVFYAALLAHLEAQG